jgi:hypothetical protein
VTGKGHPLPASDEARHNEIPEHLERDKGRGDDPEAVNQPADDPVTPEGERYAYGDLGRGAEQTGSEDEFAQDQAAHQDRGQSDVETEGE